MRIIAFGDSWTAGHGVEDNIRFKEVAGPPECEGFVTKLRLMNSWVRWLANKFDCPYVNSGVCGIGNNEIYKLTEQYIEKSLYEIGDIIIVVLSYPFREGTYEIEEQLSRFENLLKNKTHFYFNSFYPSFNYIDNFDYSTLPKYFINPTQTMSEVLRQYEIENNIGVWEYGSRSVWNDEKNFYEGDYHPNLQGYKLIADYIYNNIKEQICT